MLSALLKILGFIANLGAWMLWALESAVNGLVKAVGAFVGVVVALLPGMPAAPSWTGSDWVGYMNWFFPVGPMVAAAAGLLTLWTGFLVARIALNWVKAL